MKRLAVALLLVLAAAPALAQDEAARRPAAKEGPWFGVALPPKANGALAVNVGARPARPVTFDAAAEFDGTAIKADVENARRYRPPRARHRGDRHEPDVETHLGISIEQTGRRLGSMPARRSSA